MNKLLTILAFLLAWNFLAGAQNVEWAKQLPKFYPYFPSFTKDNVIIKPDGNNIVLARSFYDSAQLERKLFICNDPFDPTNDFGRTADIYVAKYNSAGRLLWANHIYSLDFDDVYDLAIDKHSNIYITGTFSNNLTINNLQIANSFPYKSSFIAKFNSAGILQWYKTSEKHNFKRILTDNDANIIILGNLIKTSTFGQIALSPRFEDDCFLAKCDYDGNYIWAIPQSVNKLYDIAVNSFGEILIEQDLKSTKYNKLGSLIWDKKLLNIGFFEIGDIVYDKYNNVYYSGFVHGNNFDFGNINLNTGSSYLNGIIAKSDNKGNWLWAKFFPIDSDYYYSLFNYSVYKPKINLTIDNSDNLYFFTSFKDTVFYDNTIITDSLSNKNLLLAKCSASDGSLIKSTILAGSGNVNFGVINDDESNVFIVGTVDEKIDIGPYQIVTQPRNTRLLSGYFAKLNYNTNGISGEIYIDSNHNGIRDSTEHPYIGGIVQTSLSNNYGVSNQKGEYNLYSLAGKQDITVQTPKYYSSDPDKYAVNFSGTGQQTTGKDFALYANEAIDDIQCKITSVSLNVRPGFKMFYRLTYQNLGTTILSDSLLLLFDPNLKYDSATYRPSFTRNKKIYWTFKDLKPFERRDIDVFFTIDSSTPIGSTIKSVFTAPLHNDANQTNNQDSVSQIITGSYDPNDKHVRQRFLTPEQLQNETELDYTIRFQNTGNDTAFTVIVQDFLPSNVDITSLQTFSASHDYEFKMTKEGKAEWQFDNILLPDSGTNELLSHGFIRFRIKPNTDLKVGDSISNSVAIYFDYNMPVFTNAAVTRIVSPQSNNSQSFKNLMIYPNPTEANITIETELDNAGVITLKLINMLGQEILSKELHSEQHLKHVLDISAYSQGMYIIQLQAGDKQISERVFKW